MHAITITEPGGPDVLAWSEVPDPVVREGEVLVDVAATAVNRADVAQRQGVYPPPPGGSEYPGLECSGTIAELGPGTDGTGWSVGDRVCALLTGGGYAERVAVPVGQLLPVPRGVSLTDAAALPEVACTVWSNLVMVGGLRAGQTVLVHGGGSGIGTFAVQFAKALGARVAVTAGSEEKLERCRELGAEITVNYRTGNFTEVLRAEGGADLILDIMGGSYLDANLRSLATNGRLVIIGLMGGGTSEIDLGRMLVKRLSVQATTLRSRPPEEKAAIVAGVLEEVWPLIEEGTIRPVVDRELSIEDAAEAHRVLESSAHTGKILLTR
ncbi:MULTISPECIES: NAD(P)H-quinone oxidoreductase [unclassified Nocardiopsis]|uniref:NAD(P)H-quinone oxidoreductase n=1 Tax=unclassified Nocardiopsis TaxID=2649073 RepID=UPI00066DF6CF|nr:MULTISPECIES: NAD(P)H-quinone oxidoreductase [unclassified Nocardiopsis]MBQ1083370.1 NAD(P)H-quinone oxidoreductase [Nocardiopsis sp. B62]